MAESVKVIDPDLGSGYDYDSLFDWEAAQQADIDTSNTIAVAKCRCTSGTADATAVTIDGWTTSAADYIKIWTDPAESYRHSGIYETGNHYRIETTTNSISVGEKFCYFIGLQIGVQDSPTIGLYFYTAESNGFYYLVDKCIFKGPGLANSMGSELYMSTSRTGSLIYSNCIVYNFTDVTSVGLAPKDTGNCYIYNCTIKNCMVGVAQEYGTTTLKNCLFSGCTTDATGTISDTYCSTSNDNTKGLTALGTGNRFGQTFSFVGAADFHLQSTDEGALGFGLNLYNDAAYPFQTDIDGQDRGGAAAAWDIGADEYVSAASIELEGFRFRNDDGSETTATWKANQDVNITSAADTAMRLRMLLNATGDPASIGAQLEYRYKPSGGAFGGWTKVT